MKDFINWDKKTIIFLTIYQHKFCKIRQNSLIITFLFVINILKSYITI